MTPAHNYFLEVPHSGNFKWSSNKEKENVGRASGEPRHSGLKLAHWSAVVKLRAHSNSMIVISYAAALSIAAPANCLFLVHSLLNTVPWRLAQLSMKRNTLYQNYINATFSFLELVLLTYHRSSPARGACRTFLSLAGLLCSRLSLRESLPPYNITIKE
jgi:hypothetical protein